MSTITNEAKIRVAVDAKNAIAAIRKMSGDIQNTFKKARSAATRFKNSVSSLSGVMKTAMAAFVVKDLVAASNEQERAVAAFEQALRSMGRYSEEFSSQMQRMASTIQGEGIIGDEVLLRGAKFLATYKNITNKTMPRAMKVMADFAALTGGDVASAANILGKASMGMTGEMARYGITLSETAKQSKDFSLILKEIEEQVGGQNKALAETRAGGLQQFANAVGDLKERGGDLLKIFIIPFTRLLSPLVDMLNKLNNSTAMMIGTLGLAAATIFKVVIPALKAFGITSKAAMGWVGAIIALLELLYVAWDTNFLGIRDTLSRFWEFVKDFSRRVGESFFALGKIISGMLSFDKDSVLEGWNELKTALVEGWGETMRRVRAAKTEAVKAPKPGTIIPAYEEAGSQAGAAFNRGLRLGKTGLTGNARSSAMGAGPERLLSIAEKTKAAEISFSAFDRFNEKLYETKATAAAAFQTIESGIHLVSDRLVDAMWGGRMKLQDVWKSIAKDFTKMFVDEVLRIIMKTMVVKMLEALALFDRRENDLMAKRVGRDYAKHFTKGVMDGLAKSNLAGAIAGNAPRVNVNIGAENVYGAVNSARERELIRRGQDINRDNFQ